MVFVLCVWQEDMDDAEASDEQTDDQNDDQPPIPGTSLRFTQAIAR